MATSFALDFIVKDRDGGDVDTIHNVRNEKIKYKNKQHQKDYDNRGDYNSSKYHSHKGYREKNKQVKIQKEDGTLKDAYTGANIGYNGKSDLDDSFMSDKNAVLVFE